MAFEDPLGCFAMPGRGCSDVARVGKTKPPTKERLQPPATRPGPLRPAGRRWAVLVEGSLGVWVLGVTGSHLEPQTPCGVRHGKNGRGRAQKNIYFFLHMLTTLIKLILPTQVCFC